MLKYMIRLGLRGICLYRNMINPREVGALRASTHLLVKASIKMCVTESKTKHAVEYHIYLDTFALGSISVIKS